MKAPVALLQSRSLTFRRAGSMERGYMFLIRLLCVAIAMSGVWRVVSAEAVVDAKASAILNSVSAQLAAAKTAEVELRLAVTATNGPAAVGDLAANYALSVERPNKMALVLKQGTLGATVISDGTNTVTFIPQPPTYTVQKASKQIGAAEIGSQAADMGSMAFISAMFSDNPRGALLAGVSEAKYGGRVKIGDVECERIDMKQEDLNWRLFASTGEKAFVRRIEVVIPQLNMSMDFTGWKLNGVIPRERFKFVPPPEAKKVDKLLDGDEKEGEDSDLVDAPMPKLKLKTVDGADFDTAMLKDRVTLLVVWAGEAEHCINAMKAGSELASARKGVGVYTINIDEKPDKARIKNLLTKNKLRLPTAIDTDNREAVEKFEVEGVPTTFLIDKAGVIRKAFLGYHNDFKALLGKEIDALQNEKK
jgi:hypothetical protein